jgi:hypothetical protein
MAPHPEARRIHSICIVVNFLLTAITVTSDQTFLILRKINVKISFVPQQFK